MQVVLWSILVFYGFMNLFVTFFDFQFVYSSILLRFLLQLHQCKNNIDSTANSQNGDVDHHVLMCMSLIFLSKKNEEKFWEAIFFWGG